MYQCSGLQPGHARSGFAARDAHDGLCDQTVSHGFVLGLFLHVKDSTRRTILSKIILHLGLQLFQETAD